MSPDDIHQLGFNMLNELYPQVSGVNIIEIDTVSSFCELFSVENVAGPNK